MSSFYDIAIYLLGDVPVQFTFMYSILAFILCILCISVVFMLFKLTFNVLGLR